MITLSSAYLGPILHYALLSQNETYEIDTAEHFVKQSYRSRCEIYGANGRLKLIVPLEKWKNNSPIKDIKISYDENWQSLHWRSFESAYRLSPFFDFFEEDFRPFYEKKYSFLIELNRELEEKIKSLLKITATANYTETYKKCDPDYRKLISPKNKAVVQAVNFEHYYQVFEDKYGFLENLSILDLLFNLGPASKAYLLQTKII